jgi:low affinity Fe/Cu permease
MLPESIMEVFVVVACFLFLCLFFLVTNTRIRRMEGKIDSLLQNSKTDLD